MILQSETSSRIELQKINSVVIWSCKKSQMHPLKEDKSSIKDKAFNVNVWRENLQSDRQHPTSMQRTALTEHLSGFAEIPFRHGAHWSCSDWKPWFHTAWPKKKKKGTGDYLLLDFVSCLVYITCILKGLLTSRYVPNMVLPLWKNDTHFTWDYTFSKHGLRLKISYFQINMREIAWK